MKIIHVIGRLGMGGDTVAVLNTLNVLFKERKLNYSDVDFLTHDIGYNKQTVEQLRNKGHKVIILKGDVRKLGPYRYYMEVKSVVTENGPYDVVHIHTSMQSGVALCAAKSCGVPKRICHCHTNSIQRNTNIFINMFISPLFRILIKYSATQNVACGKNAGDFLFKRRPYIIIKNGINIKKYENISPKDIAKIKSELKLEDTKCILGHVGRFSAMKNHDFILDLARKLKNQKEFVFVMVGDGEKFENIQKQIITEGLNCVLTGRRDDIPILMNMFDLLLLPSLKGEGFPITLVEAQTVGCPCLVADSVPHEVCLIKDLVSFVTLDELLWLKVITQTERNKKESSKCSSIVRNMGFEESDAANAWYSLYL